MNAQTRSPHSAARTALLAGAAALVSAGAALAQARPGDAGATVTEESPMAAIVEEERLDVDGARADGAGSRSDADATPAPADPALAHTQTDVFADGELAGVAVEDGSPEAQAAAAAGGAPQEAVDRLLTDAQEEAKQNGHQIIPAETDETEIVLDAHPAAETAPATAAAARDEPDEVQDVALLQTFMEMDTDGDLLVSEAEFAAFQGWDAGRAPAFDALDINSTGSIGFGEYRVWSAIQAETSEPGA